MLDSNYDQELENLNKIYSKYMIEYFYESH